MSAATAEPQADRPPRDQLLGAWLLLICACVIAMILVGGATRLTDSGLSITEWRLDKGLIPPTSEARWNEEFALYQQTTEFREQNFAMTRAEFQHIYWWEWGHRFLGKLIGVVFALPFLLFWIWGRLKGRFWPVLTLFALGGAQGGVGWWMVQSGLFSGLDVSPLRLAIHLGLAFVILALGFSLALSEFHWPRPSARLGAPRWAPALVMALLLVQILFGALLAGADAGRAYPEWPTIGGEFFPSTYAALEPFARNLVENHAAQHFNHRTLGYVVAGLALLLALIALVRGEGAGRWAGAGLGVAALAQAGLGVGVVLAAAPLSLSLAHQGLAILLWLAAIAALACAKPADGNKLPLT
jgi:cytochrome c oxidase assembly protein subunit 15